MTVIQGSFPHGLPRTAHLTTAAQPFAVHATPSWVQARIGAHGAPKPVQRITAPPRVAQPLTHPNAVQLPQHMAPRAAHGGQPLPPQVRQKMEAVFRSSFSDVRIHVGPEATALGATAFTHGSHIHFAPGQYDPHTSRGQQVLGRELAHVVQQRAGRVRNPFGSGVAVVQDRMLEAEAERMAIRASDTRVAARGTTVQRSSESSSSSSSGSLSSNSSDKGSGGGGKKDEFKFNAKAKIFVFKPQPKITKAAAYKGDASHYEECRAILAEFFKDQDVTIQITNGKHKGFENRNNFVGYHEYFDYEMAGVKYHHYTGVTSDSAD
ncbi:MAG TPA: DUF4157 domain-containing protein [Thermoanaerobaculia bacterium]|nr:DUF4157 domain-containing protein [Thermoanaerobaculia bacterium]